MSDIISEIRYALRGALLNEDVQKQSTIFFTVVPGEKPKWASAPSESHIKIFAVDRGLSRGNEGFLGREWFCPQHPQTIISNRDYEGKDKHGKVVKTPHENCATCGAALTERPRGSTNPNAPEELGAWHAVGLPDQTASGFKGMGSKFPGPSPWVIFMDWFWDFLKNKGTNPSPYKGFGDINAQYSKLAPNRKRWRKYGQDFEPQMEPGEELPPALKSIAKTANWPKGFDIGKDVTIIVDSLGNNQDEVTRNFQKLLVTAQVPNYMRIIPDTEEHRWFVSFDYETEDKPDEIEARRKNVDIYKTENREKWINAIRTLAAGKTNPAQLAPLVRKWLVAKHKFQRPFHVDVLSPEEFTRAVETISRASLDELVAFAKEIGEAPPVIGGKAAAPTGFQRQEIIMGKRWVQTIDKLAEQGGVEPALVEVALADYLSKNGFEDPFEFDIASPATQAKALVAVGTLTFDDIRSMLEAVQQQVRSLMG